MKIIFLKPIFLYQQIRQGFFIILGVVPTACRFEPSCSTYAYQSISKHGIIRGGFGALKRVIRCRPGNSGGWDPVK